MNKGILIVATAFILIISLTTSSALLYQSGSTLFVAQDPDFMPPFQYYGNYHYTHYNFYPNIYVQTYRNYNYDFYNYPSYNYPTNYYVNLYPRDYYDYHSNTRHYSSFYSNYYYDNYYSPYDTVVITN
jgi:hypothetical protein